MRNLSSAEASATKKILNDAGPSFTQHDSKTWSTQAKLIIDEGWGKLKNTKTSLMTEEMLNCSIFIVFINSLT